jgi:FkbM family methyltransferase
MNFLKQLLLELQFRTRERLLKSDQEYEINGVSLVIPRTHRLPLLQRIYPSYDTYFFKFFKLLNDHVNSGIFIDVGANVGDTTAAVLSVAPKFKSVLVEGSPTFLPYMRLNSKQFGTRVSLVEEFLFCERNLETFYVDDGTTGSFQKVKTGDNSIKTSVSPATLLSGITADIVIWKSDTDGFDLPIFLENFELITSNTKIWWLELHPHLMPTTPEDVSILASSLAELGADGALFDNYGKFIAAARGHDLKILINSTVDLLNNSTRALGKRLQYFDLIAFHPETGLNISNADLIAALIN